MHLLFQALFGFRGQTDSQGQLLSHRSSNILSFLIAPLDQSMKPLLTLLHDELDLLIYLLLGEAISSEMSDHKPCHKGMRHHFTVGPGVPLCFGEVFVHKCHTFHKVHHQACLGSVGGPESQLELGHQWLLVLGRGEGKYAGAELLQPGGRVPVIHNDLI